MSEVDVVVVAAVSAVVVSPGSPPAAAESAAGSSGFVHQLSSRLAVSSLFNVFSLFSLNVLKFFVFASLCACPIIMSGYKETRQVFQRYITNKELELINILLKHSTRKLLSNVRTFRFS